MRVEVRLQNYKLKLNKKTKKFWRTQKSGTPEIHRYMISHFNTIKKCGKRTPKQGNMDS